ncbi:LacI family DNA-binding transcriptional regulator [Amycolatopsis sp. RTGN1]|uniref:substrate-binding domain-containing protein n=1 Tax=Amycolatopsis ponsaeliensis TaxID=2992142 RepID=UPI00254BE68A|nr:LacI family DNA-binding transcriptional regulator [Amycolatopsis sp. RTGN1]
MKRPTITDIAREAGVSKGAVSYALNGRPGVSEATRHRITRIARELGWSPSSTARALSGGRAGAIGLVLDGPSELVVPALLDGFSPELVVQVATSRDAVLAVYRRWRAERKVDGVLLTDPDCAAELVRIGLPAVVLGGPGGLPGVPSVRVDDTAGAAEALEYLAALGHRRVVRIPGAAAFAEEGERAEAFTTEARRLGLVGGIGDHRGAELPDASAANRGGGRGADAGPAARPTAGADDRGGSGESAGRAGFPTAGTDGPQAAARRERGGLFGAAPAAGFGVGSGGSGDRGGAGPATSFGVPSGSSGDRGGADPAAGFGVRPGGSADRGSARPTAGSGGFGDRGGARPTAGFGVGSGGSGDRGSAQPTTGFGVGSGDRGSAQPTGARNQSGRRDLRSALPAPGSGNRTRQAAAVRVEPSADAVRQILTSHPRPTALLCDTDVLAVAALVAARELGLAVPGDLSVVSWDDSVLCHLVRPALSAIRRPLPELGGLAASMLRDLIAGEEVGDVWASRPRLITRGSTGPAR